MDDTAPSPVRRAVIGAAIGVALLRLYVGWQQLALPALQESDTQLWLQMALGALGLGYLASGIFAFTWAGTRATVLFALHGICQGVHWGVPLTVGSEHLQLAVWVTYFVISMLGISALLHFILLFTQPWKIASHRAALWFLYLPVALGAVAGVVAVLAPSNSVFLSLFLVLEALQVNLYELLGLGVLAIRFGQANSRERKAYAIGVMLWGSVLGVLPYILALIAEAAGLSPPGGLGSEPYVMFFILSPLAFAYAIVRNARVSAQEPLA